MNPVFIDLPEFQVIGCALNTSTLDGRNFSEIPAFWDQVLAGGQIVQIKERIKAHVLLGICLEFKSNGDFTYIIGAEVASAAELPPGMIHKTIPAAYYAVFTATGPMESAIQQTVRYAYGTWLPDSSFLRAPSADFELYDERSCKGEEAQVDIYIPVVAQITDSEQD